MSLYGSPFLSCFFLFLLSFPNPRLHFARLLAIVNISLSWTLFYHRLFFSSRVCVCVCCFTVASLIYTPSIFGGAWTKKNGPFASVYINVYVYSVPHFAHAYIIHCRVFGVSMIFTALLKTVNLIKLNTILSPFSSKFPKLRFDGVCCTRSGPSIQRVCLCLCV